MSEDRSGPCQTRLAGTLSFTVGPNQSSLVHVFSVGTNHLLFPSLRPDNKHVAQSLPFCRHVSLPHSFRATLFLSLSLFSFTISLYILSTVQANSKDRGALSSRSMVPNRGLMLIYDIPLLPLNNFLVCLVFLFGYCLAFFAFLGDTKAQY